MDQIQKQFCAQQNVQNDLQAQMNPLTVQFEMRSIHSSNSANSNLESRQDTHLQIISEPVSEAIREKVCEPFQANHDEPAPQSAKQKYRKSYKRLNTNKDYRVRLREIKQRNQSLNKASNMLQNEEVISNYDDNLLEDSFTSSKQLQQLESIKIYPKRNYPKLSSDQLRPLSITEAVRNTIEEVSPRKQYIISSNSKNRQKSKQFFIACQRNNNKVFSNQEKPKYTQIHLKKKQEKSEQETQPYQNDLKLQLNLEFEQYFQKCKFEFCGQQCTGGNEIQMICVQKGCQLQATHCDDSKCIGCKENHKNCFLKFSKDMFNKSLQRNLLRQKKTMQIVFEAYSNILKEIKQNREKIMKFLCVQGASQSLLNKLQSRYKTHGHISFKSNEILNVLQMLNAQSQKNQYRERKIYEKMKKDKKCIIDKLQQQMHLLLEPYASCAVNILDSHLISSKADAKFILENLNFPKDMELLYRASEHEFSIKKFHQICDNERNTFTIFKTEFGKLIGGFTPLKWNDKYGRDRSNKTFLLSISMKERLDHINQGLSAIHYNDSFGPSFGGLFETRDIQIFEQNGIINCNTNFPSAYNWKKFFTSNQDSWRFLTGVQRGNKCRIMDYQVFKVHFWNKKQ